MGETKTFCVLCLSRELMAGGNLLVNEGIKQFEVAVKRFETVRKLYERQEMTIIFLHGQWG